MARSRTVELFPPPAEAPATKEVVVPRSEAPEPRPRRQFAIKTVETVTERLEPEEKVCPHCGKEKCEIGCEKSERFEYIPAKVVRHEIIRPKLACKCGRAGVSIAPLPEGLVLRGSAGSSLVAQVILAKYVDHLPLYRQQQIFARLGVNIPRSTLGDWVRHGATWLQGIVSEMKRQLLAGDYLQADETPVNVMDPDVKGKTAKGYLWVMGLPGQNVVFEFHPGRGKAEAKKLLDGFKGYLQRDGYSAYSSLVREPGQNLIPVGSKGMHLFFRTLTVAFADFARGELRIRAQSSEFLPFNVDHSDFAQIQFANALRVEIRSKRNEKRRMRLRMVSVQCLMKDKSKC